MKPTTAARLVSSILSIPGLLVGAGVGGSFLAAGPAAAQASELSQALAHAPDGAVPAWLAPILPLLVGALGGAGMATVAWLLRTLFGVSLVAVAAALEASAAVLELRARKSADPLDDGPASAAAAAMRAAAAKLRDAEHDMPGAIKRPKE